MVFKNVLKAALASRTVLLKPSDLMRFTIQALNEYGEEVVIIGKGEMAKCFCHELEHLDGKIFLDKAIEEIDM